MARRRGATRLKAKAVWSRASGLYGTVWCRPGRRKPSPVTDGLTRALHQGPGAPQPGVLRQSLFSWAFNPATRDTDPSPEVVL